MDQKEGVQCKSETELDAIDKVMTERKRKRMDIPKQNGCKK